MSRAPIQSIVVISDGIVGLSAALAFRRALRGVRISLLCTPPDPAAITDQLPIGLPAIGRFHAAIGFDERVLVARQVAVHHLGTRFEDGPAGAWTHDFGTVGRSADSVPFRQLWLAARRRNSALAYDRYSPASALGEAGKFVHPSGDPASPLASYLYGLRLNPERYRAELAEATADVARTSGRIVRVERRDDGGVKLLHLDDERHVAADLFVDCSGPGSALAPTDDVDFEDWSAWLPAVHVAFADEVSEALNPLARVAAIDRGWQLSATVPGATLHVSVTTAAMAGSVKIRPGRRRNSFVANVLTVGDGAIALDLLHGANLGLAHSAILRAIALLPGRNCDPVELAEYNRLTALEADRARDFHILFQSALGEGAPPASLARTLVQWRARGRLPFFEEETYSEAEWEQALFGQGILPEAIASTAHAIDAAAAQAAMASFARELETLAARLPTYADYLARLNEARRV